MVTKKIDWKKLERLERFKKKISDWKKLYGTESTIKFCQGLLGLRYGEYGKYKERIRKFVKKL
jgi:hypothetical protein